MTPERPCLLCLPQHGWLLLRPWLACTQPYARLRCQCADHRHRLLIAHPHVPGGCAGFDGIDATQADTARPTEGD